MEHEKKGHGAETDRQEGGSAENAAAGIPERLTFAVSVFIVLSALGMLIWFGTTEANEPPTGGVPMAEVRIDWADVAQRGDRWLLPVTVENVGEAPLEEVSVVVETTLPTGEKEETDIAITFLAEEAEETVYVVADARPDPMRVRARVATLRTRHDTRGY